MPSVIAAGTTAGSAISVTGDTTGNLAFQTNGTTTAMTITTGQNVGIGTTNPGYKLDVTGATSTYIGVASTNASTGSGLFTTNATRTYLIGAGAASGNSNLEFRDVTGSATRMSLDTSGNLGIGTSSPTSFSGYTVVDAYNGTTGAFFLVRNPTKTGQFTVDTNGVRIGSRTNDFLALTTNDTERMRIASNGVVSIGTTNQSAQLTVDATTTGIYSSVTGAFVAGYFLTGGANYAVYGQSSANYGIYGRTTDASYGGCIGVAGNGTTYGIIGYANAWGLYTNASISVNGTTYTSDARLKENVQPISNALNTITQLNPVSFDWKANSARGITNNNTPLPDYGMIAQEVEQVLPDIVYEVPVPPKPIENNESDSLEQELGSCKGVDYSRLIPFLTKAIQELKAELDVAKAEIQALKGAQ